MLHLLYILAFTVLAFLAIANLIRSMVSLGIEAQRGYAGSNWSAANAGAAQGRSRQRSVPHPEFLDDTGNVINEPLLVMRSMSVEDAREHLDALFDASPSQTTEPREET
jgi:hypothetical protein